MAPIRFCFETLGCKVNQYETQALETILASRGHTASKAGEGCDAVIVNTCAVTAESGRKSRQAVRRLKKLEPEAIAAVCGCFSQVSPEEVEELGVDLVYGSGDRLKFADELERVYAEKTLKKYASEKLSSGIGGGALTADTTGPVCRGIHEVQEYTDVDKTTVKQVDDALKRRLFEELPSGSVSGRTRAMLKIQDGCQNFCTYCIIPYARGPVRSLPLDRAVAEAKRLHEEGYGEIVVTGIEISSYGKDFEDGTTVIDAIRGISAATISAAGSGATRLRIGSLEPRTITEDFCRALSQLPNICDHFHLSLQSGCDETLARMKRRYNTADFLGSVELLRQYYPNCGITADLIVGFPGESDEEFEKTLAFIKKCAFSAMHIFPYSKRPGTRAAEMPGQIDKTVKQERAHRAAKAASEMTLAYAKSCIGTVLEVLFERESAGGSDGQIVSIGHAGNYLEVCVDGTGLRNTLLPVRVICVKDGLLFGEIIKP